MEIVDNFFSFGGEQKVVKHYSSSNKCNMKFSIFLPILSKTKKVPIIWYLSGLNRSSATVKLSNKTLRIFGVKRHAAYRALDTLSRASLVAVSRSPGQCPRVTILPVLEIGGDPDE